MDNVRIAVLSDLHFTNTEAGRRYTHMDIGTPREKKQDPLKDILDLIQTEKLVADVLLCPGDLTFGAEYAGLVAAWAAIQDIAKALKCDRIIAATGNHDVSSRTSKEAHDRSSPEIWEQLKRLSPSYPYPNADNLERLSYWAEHFMVTDIDWIRVVALNSCNCHARGESEYQHGRVTDYMVEALEKELSSRNQAALNILLCHHHPERPAALSQLEIDQSEMLQGPKLVEMLGKNDARWIIVHGHRHTPGIAYAHGTAGSPVIFSAGSFSAAMTAFYSPTATNQFYILNFDHDELERYGLVGKVQSWDWARGQGWHQARFDSSRPDRIVDGSGFGNRENAIKLAEQISKEMTGHAWEWVDVLAKFPSLAYVTKEDREMLMTRLASKYSISAANNNPFDPGQLLR